MPPSKAEMIVAIREEMKGTPYKMPLSKLKLHELQTAHATLLDMKAKHSEKAESIPVVSSGRPQSRPIAPAASEDDDEDTIKVPQPPAPRLKKAPLVRTAKDPENHPLGNPAFKNGNNPAFKKKEVPKAKKEATVEEPLTGRSPARLICPCNCKFCPHK